MSHLSPPGLRGPLFAKPLAHPAFHSAVTHPMVQALAGRALDQHKTALVGALDVCPPRFRDAFARRLAAETEAAHGRPHFGRAVRSHLERLLAGATGEELPAVCDDAQAQRALMFEALPYMGLGEFAGTSEAYLQLSHPQENLEHPDRPGHLSDRNREVIANQAQRTHAFLMRHQLASPKVRRALKPVRRHAVLTREPAAQLLALAWRLAYDQTRGYSAVATLRRVARIPDHELAPLLKAAALADLAAQLLEARANN